MHCNVGSKRNKSIFCGPGDVGPWISDSTKEGLQRRRNKTWPCLDSIPGRRRWFYRKTVATIRSTMCPHLTHNAFTFSPLRTTEAFPCSEFQAEHFQALKNISQVVCFVRHRYQGSLRAWFEWSKTEDVGSIGKPDCVTHILYYLRTNRNLEIISEASLVQWGVSWWVWNLTPRKAPNGKVGRCRCWHLSTNSSSPTLDPTFSNCAAKRLLPFFPSRQ